jgi:hypothetical protein
MLTCLLQFFNISRSQNHNHLLLNELPIWPDLRISPSPPSIYVGQVAPNYTRGDLDNSITCSQRLRNIWCILPSLGGVSLDYDYAAKQLASGPKGWEKWEITFDALGNPVLDFNGTEQKMLRIVVQGRKRTMYKEGVEGGAQTDSSLFEPAKPVLEFEYDLEIASVEFVERSYTFPPKAPRTFWGKFVFFFAGDAVKDRHIVYRQAEWDNYGQYGTLKNEMGKIINEWPWDIIAIVIGSMFGSILVLYGVYRLCLLAMQQRELARWDGMDTVWERLRQEDEGGDGLLEEQEGYRDYDDDETLTGSSYRDEVVASKPLPPKPLPEKPLPAVPLIDA